MRLVIRLAALAMLVAALPAAAQNMDWNVVGSAGIADEAAVAAGLYNFNAMNAQMTAGQFGQIVLRYPVTNTYGGATSKQPPWDTFEMAYTDSGVGGFVRARLYEVDECNNTQTLIAEIVSADNDVPSCATDTVAGIDFANNVYYVEVTIGRNNANLVEILHHLALLDAP